MQQRVEFTLDMKDSYTILIPNMLPVHFKLLGEVFRLHGYNMVLLQNEGPSVVEAGLKYVHNDTCYPALLVIGQFIDALQSGRFDVDRTALIITQTGGGCRASNYIHLLRKALRKAGIGQVPVISLNPAGLEKNAGFELTPTLLLQCLFMILYADVLMCLKNQTEPYENEKGACAELVDRWARQLAGQFDRHPRAAALRFRRNIRDIARDFDRVPCTRADKVKVGIVGEIYVKYSSLANNHLERFLLEQGCEVNVPGLTGFLLNALDHYIDDIDLYGGSRFHRLLFRLAMRYCNHIEAVIARAVRRHSRFSPPALYQDTRAELDGVLGVGCKMGEGWLLTAEMCELIHAGVPNIVCVQPFGCLPNHIAGKGTIRALREKFPEANIVPIDYDPGATRVNQENRLKLMLSVAREALRPV
ncbi:MAG: 2-hydroxyacyl-CoA dehydratase [Clostridia bacterium]|nr:2-hydroxyacyl-CoA dehydratase [Clostridia bacterium]